MSNMKRAAAQIGAEVEHLDLERHVLELETAGAA